MLARAQRIGIHSISDETRCQGEICGRSGVSHSDKLISQNKAVKRNVKIGLE